MGWTLAEPRNNPRICAWKWGQSHFLTVAIATSFLTLLSVPNAYCLDPTESLTQYTQDIWGTNAGLPNSTITAFAQTEEGYLWLGTEEGLARFDGVRFTVFDEKNTPELRSNHISALVAGSGGNLWIGTQGGGLSQFRDGQFRTLTTRDGLANDAILSLYEDAAGTLWIGTDGAGLQRFREGRFTTYSSKNGLPNDVIFCLSGGKDGSLWIGTHAGLTRFQNGKFATYTTKDGLADNYIKCVQVGSAGDLWIGTNEGGVSHLVRDKFVTYTKRNGLSSDTIWSIHQDKAGSVWIGTNEAGLNRLQGGKLSTYTVKDGLPAATVMSIFEDREGDLWIGTLGGGLVRLKDGPFSVVSSREGLSNDVVLPVFEDHQGVVWVGTYGGGLNRIASRHITTLTTKDGLSDNLILSITEDQQGGLWVATRKGLDRIRNGTVKHYTTVNGLPRAVVVSLFTDRAGTLWAGTRGGGLCRFDGHRFRTYTTQDGLSNNSVASIYEDERQTLWIGTGSGLNRFENGHFSSFSTKDGLSSNVIWSITGDSDGTLWIGTSGGGLNRLKNGKFTSYTVRDGLFDDEIFQLLSDRFGYLWMTSNKGVFRVPKWQLNRFAQGTLGSIDAINYHLSDGLKNEECNGGYQPAGWRSKNGRLLFPTMKGVASVDPAQLNRNALPPSVVIERAIIDGSRFNPDSPIKAKPGKGKLEFDFTALSLVSSDRIRFKYKLDGFDKDWTDAGTLRMASYTNIPPGEYRFSVIACNNDGIWNNTGASVAFSIAPHFYQTYLFLAVCTGCIIALCFGVYRLRINHLKANEKKLVLLVQQRTKELENEVAAKERARGDLAQAQQHLIELSRLSGMAEVASGVLHNVGNVLNSVNVGTSVIETKLRELRLDNLSAAVTMLQQNSDDLATFITTDAKGQRLLPYLGKLTLHLSAEREQMVSEVESLAHHIDHIKQIVSTQQDFAKSSSLTESFSLARLLDDALRIVEPSLGRHKVAVTKEIEAIPEIVAPRHKVLEILVNLIQNAKQSIVEHGGPVREVKICLRRTEENVVRVEVHDTGVGISSENLTRIFAHGFTTKPDGHGFGLHSGAIAARQMKGALWAESKGLGDGATFILELPLQPILTHAEAPVT